MTNVHCVSERKPHPCYFVTCHPIVPILGKKNMPKGIRNKRIYTARHISFHVFVL